MPKYSKKMIKALEDTVWAYEETIRKLKGGGSIDQVRRRWDEYNTKAGCRMCCALAELPNCTGDCEPCIFYSSNHSPPAYPCVSESLLRLSDVLYKPGTKKAFINAFRKRLQWVLKRADKNGYILK